MMIQPQIHGVIPAQAGMMLMIIQVLMAARAVTMMMILMLVHNAVHVVADQLVVVLL